MSIEKDLPTEREWTVPTQAGDMTFTGQLLGRGTTSTDRHRHPGREYAAKGDRCSACRWFTCEIYAVADGQGRYMIHTRGDSIVPGEDQIPRVVFSTTALGVLTTLIQRQPLDRPDPHNRDTWTWSQPRLSRSARAAMEMAALHDEEIRNALAQHVAQLAA